MKAVMLSIRPEWCEKIASGKKTIDVRKTRPKLGTPFKCYIYCSCKGTLDPHKYLEVHADDGKIYNVNGKVMGEFTCDCVEKYTWVEDVEFGAWVYPILTVDGVKTGLDYDDVVEYGSKKPIYFWHISNLVIYDKPKSISDFWKHDKSSDCSFGYCGENSGNYKMVKAPQSWCYVEELEVQP